jgi:hypothetical protein
MTFSNRLSSTLLAYDHQQPPLQRAQLHEMRPLGLLVGTLLVSCYLALRYAPRRTEELLKQQSQAFLEKLKQAGGPTARD